MVSPGMGAVFMPRNIVHYALGEKRNCSLALCFLSQGLIGRRMLCRPMCRKNPSYLHFKLFSTICPFI
jgi:hypothetical protein